MNAPTGESTSIRIGVLLLGDDPYWVLVREAIYERAEKLGVELVEMDVSPINLSGEEQMGLLEELLAYELNGLIVQNLRPYLAKPLLDKGIPIIYLSETEIDHPLVASPYGLYDCAQMATRHLVERLDGRGHVLVVGSMIEGGESRLAGGQDVLGAEPGISVTTVLTPWGYQPAYDYTLDALEACKAPIHGVFGFSDSLALAGRDVCRLLDLADDTVVVVGINGDPLALAAIVEGTMAATVDTPSKALGCQALDLAVAAVQGEALPQHFSYRPSLITTENVAQAAARKLVDFAGMPSRMVGSSRLTERDRVRQLETSLAISKRVGSLLDWRQVRREIADLIRSSYGYDDVQIFLWSDARKEFELDYPSEMSTLDVRIPLNESGLLGYTLLRNEPTFIPDMRQSQRFPPDPYWPDTRSRVILPVRIGGKTVGLLDLHSRQSTRHSRSDLIGLQALADQLGIATRNAQLYSEALQAHAAAERASQLKSRLLANVSHGLRTPLNVILGYSQAALADPSPYGQELPPALVQDLTYIYESGAHVVRLVNDLLDLSRAEIGELDVLPEAIPTRAFLTNIFNSMAGSASRETEVAWRLQMPAYLPAIQADPLRLQQALYNLLDNAARLTDRGHITLGAAVEGIRLHIWVQDTGRGIDPEVTEQLETAIEPGQERDRAAHELRLGLRIANELIKLHHGEIELDSAPGLGSTVHIYLPLKQAERVASAAESPGVVGDGDLSSRAGALSRQAIAYIEKHYAQSLSRPEIARALDVSANHLTRVFRRDLGLTVWNYLTQYRIARAQELLCESKLSITEIAGQVGYADAAYFSRVFRREVGVSPRRYREQAQANR